MAEKLTWTVTVDGLAGFGTIEGSGDTAAAALADMKKQFVACVTQVAAQTAAVNRVQAALDAAK